MRVFQSLCFLVAHVLRVKTDRSSRSILQNCKIFAQVDQTDAAVKVLRARDTRCIRGFGLKLGVLSQNPGYKGREKAPF